MSVPMQCFILGTGGMMPMPHRRLTGIALRTGGRIYQFDAGEGVQLPYREHHLGFRNLDLICISHLHADHILGLPGMMMLRAQLPDPPPLKIIGPPGIARFLHNLRRDIPMYIKYAIDIKEYKPEDDGKVAFEDDTVKIYWRKLNHSVLCLGYRIEEHNRPGRFDLEEARKLGVPPGPMFGRLQKGEAVTLDDGQVIEPEQVLGKARRGRHVSYTTDTYLTPALNKLMKDTDLSVIESTFLQENEQDAIKKKHLTAGMAAQVGLESGSKIVALLHFSPRYEPKRYKCFKKEAQAVNPRCYITKERDVIDIPDPNIEVAS